MLLLIARTADGMCRSTFVLMVPHTPLCKPKAMARRLGSQWVIFRGADLTTAAAVSICLLMVMSRGHLHGFLRLSACPMLLLTACSGISSALSVSAMGCCPYAAAGPAPSSLLQLQLDKKQDMLRISGISTFRLMASYCITLIPSWGHIHMCACIFHGTPSQFGLVCPGPSMSEGDCC